MKGYYRSQESSFRQIVSFDTKPGAKSLLKINVVLKVHSLAELLFLKGEIIIKCLRRRLSWLFVFNLIIRLNFGPTFVEQIFNYSLNYTKRCFNFLSTASNSNHWQVNRIMFSSNYYTSSVWIRTMITNIYIMKLHSAGYFFL